MNFIILLLILSGLLLIQSAVTGTSITDTIQGIIGGGK